MFTRVCFYRAALGVVLAAFLQGCQESSPPPVIDGNSTDANTPQGSTTTQAPTAQVSSTTGVSTTTTTRANATDAHAPADHDVQGSLSFLTQNCQVYTNNMENAQTALRRLLASVTNATKEREDAIWVGHLTCQPKNATRLRRLAQDEIMLAPYALRSGETKSSSEVALTYIIENYPVQKFRQHLADEMGAVRLPPPVLHGRASAQSDSWKPGQSGKPCSRHHRKIDQWHQIIADGFGQGATYKNTIEMKKLGVDEENVANGALIVFGCVNPWTYSGGLEAITLQCRNGNWALGNPDAYGKCQMEELPVPQCKAGHLETGYTWDFYSGCVDFGCGAPQHPVTTYHKNWKPAADCDMSQTGGTCEIYGSGREHFGTNGDISYPVGGAMARCYTKGGMELRACSRC